MAEKTKKNSPVRLPDELYDELISEQNARRATDRRKIPYGDLLLEAWNSRKSTLGAAPTIPSTSETTGATPKPDRISDTNAPWVKRLIAVLESGNAPAIELIQQNLISLCLISGVAGEPSRSDVGQVDILGKVPGALESAEGSDAEAKPAIEEHRRNRPDTRGRKKGAA